MNHTIRYLVALALCLMPCLLFSQPFPKVDTSKHVTMRGTFYSDRFVGRKTSSGEVLAQDKFTAAHRSYKFGTLLLVTNPSNGKQVIVRVNDRCPKANILDMTRRAASLIDVKSRSVKVLVLPDSYLPLWEQQEKFLDLLESGHFIDYIHKGLASLDALEADEFLYDIELMTAPSRTAAEKQLSPLPIYYRDKLTFKPTNNHSGVRVVLELSLPEFEAIEALSHLTALFPKAKIVKTT